MVHEHKFDTDRIIAYLCLKNTFLKAYQAIYTQCGPVVKQSGRRISSHGGDNHVMGSRSDAAHHKRGLSLVQADGRESKVT